jgi:hypothetical protein
MCETKTILIYFLELDYDVFHKSKEWHKTYSNMQ